MGRSVNKVILLGNLGNDPEVKYTQGGMAICAMKLATTEQRKDREGNSSEKTEWHRVKAFGKLAEICGEYLQKGSQVYFEGSIRYDESTGQDGQKRYFTDVVVDEMVMLGGRREGGGERTQRSGGNQSASRPAPARGNTAPAARETAPAGDFGDDFADDDIPF